MLHRSVVWVKRHSINKFHFKGLGDYATAVAWLDRADAIPMAMPDVREGVKDKLSQKEVEDLLSRYSSYRAKK